MTIKIDRSTLEWDRKTRRGSINVIIQDQMRRLRCTVENDSSIVILNGIVGRYRHGKQHWRARVALAPNDKISAMLGRHIRGARYELFFDPVEIQPSTKTESAPSL